MLITKTTDVIATKSLNMIRDALLKFFPIQMFLCTECIFAKHPERSFTSLRQRETSLVQEVHGTAVIALNTGQENAL